MHFIHIDGHTHSDDIIQLDAAFEAVISKRERPMRVTVGVIVRGVISFSRIPTPPANYVCSVTFL